MSVKNEDWLDIAKGIRSTLTKITPIDRYDAYGGLFTCLRAIAASVTGWQSWYHDPSTMAVFTDIEMMALFDGMRAATVALLDLDIAATESFGKHMAGINQTVRDALDKIAKVDLGMSQVV